MRPTDVPDTGLLCDLLWSDPDKDVQVGFYLRNLSEGFQTVKSETKAGNTKCCLWNLSTKWNVKHTGSGFWYQGIPQILIFSGLGRDFDFDSWINMKLLQILIFRAGARTTAESASLSELTLSPNSSTDTTLTSYAEPIRLSHVLVHCCTPSLWW